MRISGVCVNFSTLFDDRNLYCTSSTKNRTGLACGNFGFTLLCNDRDPQGKPVGFRYKLEVRLVAFAVKCQFFKANYFWNQNFVERH